MPLLWVGGFRQKRSRVSIPAGGIHLNGWRLGVLMTTHTKLSWSGSIPNSWWALRSAAESVALPTFLSQSGLSFLTIRTPLLNRLALSAGPS